MRAALAVTAANCQHSPGAGSVASANYVRIDLDGERIGVQLRRSGSYY
jgi:hypothetical protein